MSDSAITVTLKGDDKNSSWIVFKGSSNEVRQQMIDFFDFTEEQVAGLAPVELAINADTTFKAMTNIAGIGGTIMNRSEQTSSAHEHAASDAAKTPQGATGASVSDEQAKVEESPQEDVKTSEDGSQGPSRPSPKGSDLAKRFYAANSDDEVVDVWAANHIEWGNDETAQEAYNAMRVYFRDGGK